MRAEGKSGQAGGIAEQHRWVVGGDVAWTVKAWADGRAVINGGDSVLALYLPAHASRLLPLLLSLYYTCMRSPRHALRAMASRTTTHAHNAAR